MFTILLVLNQNLEDIEEAKTGVSGFEVEDLVLEPTFEFDVIAKVGRPRTPITSQRCKCRCDCILEFLLLTLIAQTRSAIKVAIQ